MPGLNTRQFGADGGHCAATVKMLGQIQNVPNPVVGERDLSPERVPVSASAADSPQRRYLPELLGSNEPSHPAREMSVH